MEIPFYGVGRRRAATQAASHVPNAELQATNAGLAAIAAPIENAKFITR